MDRAMGKGGDQLPTEVAGEDVEQRFGEALREAEGKHFFPTIDEIQPLAHARELIVALKDAGHMLVLASSAKPEEVDHYLDLLDARDLAEAHTTSEDVENTKPEPDLLLEAVRKVDGKPQDAVLLGDSIWDFQAGEAAGIRGIGLLSGGFSEQELLDAGAEVVFDSLRELMDRLGQTPLGAG